MTVSDLVGEIEGVRSRTRRAARGGAVPLAILGLLVLAASVPYAVASDSIRVGEGQISYFVPGVMYRTTFFERLLNAHPNVTGSGAIGVYWLFAAPVALAAVAAYYVWRSRRTGISVSGWLVAAVAGVLFVLLVGTMAYAGYVVTHDFDDRTVGVADVINPFLVVAVAVFVLAWVERSVTVLLAALHFTVFLGMADAYAYSSLSNLGFESLAGWGTATAVLGGVLLLWAGILAVVRRPRT